MKHLRALFGLVILLVLVPGNNTIHAIWSLQGTPTFSLPTSSPTATTRDWQNATGNSFRQTGPYRCR